MKKYNYNFFLLVALLGFSSCKETNDSKLPEITTITLISPDACNFIDLEAVREVSFSWISDPNEGTSANGYTLCLSKSQDLSMPFTQNVSNLTHSIPKANLDVQLRKWGFGNSVEDTIYWSVKPATDVETVTPSETRPLILKSLPQHPPVINLLAPIDGASIHLKEVELVYFSWQWSYTGIYTGEYTFLIAKDKNFEYPVSFNQYINNSRSISAEELNKQLLEWGFEFDTEATIYWIVKDVDGFAVVPNARTLKLTLIPQQ